MEEPRSLESRSLEPRSLEPLESRSLRAQEPNYTRGQRALGAQRPVAIPAATAQPETEAVELVEQRARFLWPSRQQHGGQTESHR